MGSRFLPSFWQEPAWREPNQWSEANNLIRSLVSNVEDIRREAGADVVAFYLACDPFAADYLSCLASPGATYPDACSHFLTPRDSSDVVAFFPDATLDPMRSGTDDDLVAALLRSRPDPLYGDFIARERIVSRGRLRHTDPMSGRTDALLTVNFRRPFFRDEWDRLILRIGRAFGQMVDDYAAEIRRLLQKKSKSLYPPFFGMLDLVDPLSRPTETRDAKGLMRSLLEQAIPPLDKPGRRWCGTVHRLTPDGRGLELIASAGDFPTPPRTILDLAAGEGVISWVALRRQAVRIREMADSPFRSLLVEYLSGIRSMLAVPILFRDKLWGTLSLEATDPNVFRRQEVGYLTRVASLAAMAAMQAEYDRVREERDLYLDAVYEARRAEVPDGPLPTFEELVAGSGQPGLGI